MDILAVSSKSDDSLRIEHRVPSVHLERIDIGKTRLRRLDIFVFGEEKHDSDLIHLIFCMLELFSQWCKGLLGRVEFYIERIQNLSAFFELSFFREKSGRLRDSRIRRALHLIISHHVGDFSFELYRSVFLGDIFGDSALLFFEFSDLWIEFRVGIHEFMIFPLESLVLFCCEHDDGSILRFCI